MQNFSNLVKGIQRKSVTDQNHQISDRLQSLSLLGNDDIDTVDRAKLYRQDLMLYTTVDEVRTVHVIFPCQSRQQLNVSTLYDLHFQIQQNDKTPVSYKLTSTINAHGEEVHRLPTHRSTIYVHKLCNNCNGVTGHI